MSVPLGQIVFPVESAQISVAKPVSATDLALLEIFGPNVVSEREF